MSELRAAYERIAAEVARAAERGGRDPKDVEIMAVTKTHLKDTVLEAYHAGIRLFGENRVAEAVDKFRELPADISLHLIGHLQRNKAKAVPGVFECVESIDKEDTLIALQQRLDSSDQSLDILFEVNTTAESAKFGVSTKDELYSLFERAMEMPRLRPRGLMTVGPYTADSVAVRESFRRLKKMADGVVARFDPPGFATLSMGMSGDYTIAVEEGSTRIRVGTALFGSRP